MVVKTEYMGGSYFLHCAWADDEEGSGFSLTEYDDALMRGSYTDQKEDESSDPSRYSWTYIEDGQEEGESDTDDEEDTSDLEERITDLEDLSDDLSASSDAAGMDISSTQANSDAEIGNVNLLTGTNKGAEGWTSSEGITLADTEDTIYTDLDLTDFLTVTCTAAGSGWIAFSSDDLLKELSQAGEESSYTLSFDVRESSLFSIPVSFCDEDKCNAMLTFDAVDLASEDPDRDNADAWIHFTSTALSAEAAASSQKLYFALSEMPADATLDIANLKVEAGALATPWRESLSEINAKAEAAKQAADQARETADELDDSVSGLQEDVYGDGGITETITGLVGETKTVTDENGEAVYDEITYTDSDGTSHTEKVARTERIPGRLDELDTKVQDAADKAEQAVEGQEQIPSIQASIDEAKEILKEWSLDDGSGSIDGSKIAKGTITSEKIAAGALLISNFSKEALSLINQPLKYIRSASVDGELVIEIGEEGSPYKVTISKQGMNLYAGGSIAAFFNTDTMKITKARILESIRFGSSGDGKDDFSFVPQPNGNLSFKLLEDQEG